MVHKHYYQYKKYTYSPRSTKMSKKQAYKLGIIAIWALMLPILSIITCLIICLIIEGGELSLCFSLCPIIGPISMVVGIIIGFIRVVYISSINIEEYLKKDIERQIKTNKMCPALKELINLKKEF